MNLGALFIGRYHSRMSDSQHDFLELALAADVLKLGDFTLKSGRISPYFFNLGVINRGAQLAKLGELYATALLDSDLDFDMLFGPAYKGIPLVSATAVVLAAKGRDVPYAYNRKEAKDHGEGGRLVGAPPEGRVVIVDDVITAGTAVREAISMIQQAGAEVAAVLIAMDRQEKVSEDTGSAVDALRAEGIEVISLATLTGLISFLDGKPEYAEVLEKMRLYRERYGSN